MIAKVLVFACAALGLVSANCFKQCNQFSQPMFVESSPVVSSPCMSSQVMSSPVMMTGNTEMSGNLFSGEMNVNEFGSGMSTGMATGSLPEPESVPLPVVQAPPVTLPTVEAPMVTLSAPAVPAPRVIASRCVCTKTVVKPQVYQRVVTVPKVQRYFKRTVTPVVENLVYKSRPLTSSCSSSSSMSGLVSGSGMVSTPFVVSGNSCGTCN